MSKCPQARPHRKALVFIGGRLLKLVIPLQVFLPLEVTYKPIVPLVLHESQLPTLHAGYSNSKGVRKALLCMLSPDSPNFVAGIQAVVAPVGVCDPAHVFRHILSLDGNMVAPVTDERQHLDGICHFLNLSANVGELADECSPAANKALHGFIPVFQSG